MSLKLFYCSALLFIHGTAYNVKKPNILFIVADDMGWNDVSLHGSDQIPTPNIDVIGYQGVILHQYYSDTQGTAARSALFTGKYPMRLGTQGSSIKAGEDRGVPVSERLLPFYLKQLGYITHLIGKWQLGKSRDCYLPTNRGFDTFYGFLDGSVDYYTYNHIESWNGTVYHGLDFFDNFEPVEHQNGHLTDILTDRAVELIRDHDKSVPLYLHMSHAAPHAGGGLVNLQTPDETIAANDHIAHSARRIYAGLVTGLDRSVGQLVAALAEREMLQNTIVIFVSDNGAATKGMTQNYGSNLPLRGLKATPWEGAVRSTAAMWHTSIRSKIWRNLFHVTDWLPTLIAAAGGNVTNKIDGINQWQAITNDDKPPRHDALITIDDLGGWGAFREGDFKLIIGDVDENKSKYYGMELNEFRHAPPLYTTTLLESETARVFKEILNVNLDIDSTLQKRSLCNLNNKKNKLLREQLCVPTKNKGCLFNISADPLEANDLWASYPEIVRHMTLRLRLLWSELIPRQEAKFDNRSNPSRHGYVWFPWLENDEKTAVPLITAPKFPLHVSVGELQYLVDTNLNIFKEGLGEYVKSVADSFVQSISSFLA